MTDCTQCIIHENTIAQIRAGHQDWMVNLREALQCPPDAGSLRRAAILARFHDDALTELAEIGAPNVREVVEEVKRLKAEIADIYRALSTLTYTCAVCGGIVTVEDTLLDNGAALECPDCGDDTVVRLFSREDYVAQGSATPTPQPQTDAELEAILASIDTEPMTEGKLARMLRLVRGEKEGKGE